MPTLESKDPAYKKWLLQKNNLDPSKFDLDDEGIAHPRQIAQPTINESEVPLVDPTPAPEITTKPQTTVGQTLLHHGASSIVPTAAGLGTAGLAGLALGVGSGPIGWATLAGLGVAGAVGGYGASKLQDQVLPDAAKQQLALEAEQHPIASFVGGQLPSLAAFNPVKSLKALPDVVRHAKTAFSLGLPALKDTEQALLASTLSNMGVAGGIDTATQLASGQDFSIPQLAANIGTAGLLNTPTSLGRKLMFHRDQPVIRDAVVEQPVSAPVEEPVSYRTPSSISGEVPIDTKGLMGTRENRPELRSGSARTADVRSDAMARYKSNPDEVNTHGFEDEGGLIVKDKPSNFDLAELEKSKQDLNEQKKAQAELNRQEAAQLASDNAARALELKRTLEENQVKKSSGLGVGLEKVPPAFKVAKPGVEVEPDYTGVQEDTNVQVKNESLSDLQAREQEARLSKEQKPKYQEESSITSKQKELLQNYYKAANTIAGRTAYGKRAEESKSSGYVASWSNAEKKWNIYLGLGKVSKGQQLNLDSNQILIRGNNVKDAQLVASHLPPLPLDTHSFENSPLTQLDQTNKSGNKILQEMEEFWNEPPKTPNVVEHVEKFMDKLRSPEQVKYQEEQVDNTDALLRNAPSAYRLAVYKLAARRGISLKEAASLVNPETGKQVLGQAETDKRQVTLNEQKAELDTPFHEIGGHQFVDDLSTSTAKADRDLAERAKAIFESHKKGSEEGLAIDQGVRGADRQITSMQGSRLDKAREWTKDFIARWKNNVGVASDEDILRHLNQRVVTDAPYGTRNELTEYNTLVSSFKNEKDEGKRIEIQKQIEALKNKNGGMAPKFQDESSKSSYLPLLKPEIEKINTNKELGEHGPRVGKAFESFYEKQRELRGKLTNDVVGSLRDHLNFLNPKEAFTQNNESFNRVLQVMDEKSDGKKPSIVLNDKEKEIEAIVRKSMTDTLKEKNSRPGLPTTKADENYFPHVVGRKQLNILLNKPNSQEARTLIKDFYDYQIEHSFKNLSPEKALSAAKKQLEIFKAGYETKNKNLAAKFGPIDRSEGVGIPASWREKNLIDRVSRFTNRYARRLAYHDTIETNKDVVDSLTNPEYGIGNVNEVKNVMGDIGGEREYEESKRNAISGVIRAAMLGPITGSKDFVSNLVLGFQHQDLRQSLQSPIHAWSNMKENIVDSFKAGVNSHAVGSFEFGDGGIEDVTNMLRATRDILNEVQGRNMLERLTRATAYGQGKFLAMDNLASMKKGNAPSQGKKFMKDFGEGINVEEAVKRGEFSQEDLMKIAARYVESVQGKYDFRGLPAITQKGSLAPVLSLARWNVEKMNNFLKYNIEPARNGNFKPLLMSTLGMIAGGEAVNQLVQVATDKKERTPKYDEIANAYKTGGKYNQAAAYKLASLAGLAGYGGVLGDLAKSAMDVEFKNLPQSYNNPLLDGVSNAAEISKDLVEAIQSGNLDITADVLSHVLETYFQSYRVAYAHLSDEKKELNKKADDRRDLKTFKNLNGLPVSEATSDRINPFINKDVREFKKGTLEESAKLLPSLIEKALKDSGGDMELFKSKLVALKKNEAPTMPSPERTPATFYKYVKYLEDTQGSEVASRKVAEYMKNNAIDSVRASMVPSF